MRRKINLYIGDQLVDLDDQSFILFNYTMDDLSNPAIVRNSFSQQITLKGTPANNKIFGGSFRTDRRVGRSGGETGLDFNASQKTPFTIYNEMNEILESGYVKLDSIDRNGVDIQYKVTLYGGLGSFFYALSYDDNGNKRTLADLTYLDTDNPETELDFIINKEYVREAWDTLHGIVTMSSMEMIHARIKADGTLAQPGANVYYVGKYEVSGFVEASVTGRSPGSADYALASVVDANGSVLQVYEIGQGANYTNFVISLPPRAMYLYVHGYTEEPVVKYVNVERWGVINFAPAYNGIPDGNFSPDKGLIVPADVGLKNIIVDGDGEEAVSYAIRAGYALVNLAEAQDEWAVKDLRSYLQRPVFSMKAFWDAICDPANNGGYEVDASVIQDELTFGKYAKMWMTLPMITSIGSIQQESGDLSLTLSSTASAGNVVGRYDISGSVPSGTKVTANLNCKIRFNTPAGADSYSTLYRSVTTSSGRITNGKFSVIFLQAVAYASDNSIVGGSKIKVIGAVARATGATMANACGYVPVWSADYETASANTFSKVSSGIFEIPNEMGFTVTAQDVAYYKIHVSVYGGSSYLVEGAGSQTRYSYSGDGSTSTPVMYVDYDNGYTPASTFIIQGATANTITYTSSDSLRSGATITKSMLLSSSHTPADYLLSFCKVFGLYFTYDNATKKVTILRRDDLYQDETIDLTRRVDLSKGISIRPLVFDAKWYDFILEGAGGAFYDEYLNVEGIQYGIQRVNTGYDFNADAVNLMDSVVFKNACTVLARSKYLNHITRQGYMDVEIPVDLSSLTVYNNTIEADGTWSAITTDNIVFVPVTPGQKYRFYTGENIGYIAILQDDSNNTGDAASFCQDYPERFKPTQGQTITIPADGNYIYIVTKNSIGYTDTDVVLLTTAYRQVFQPSPFLDKGNTFTLWSASGETLETDISCPPSNAIVTYYNSNPIYKGYDVDTARKLELRSADNKPLDGSDILVFLEGWDDYPYFKLTDDVPAMDLLNDGVPCWLLAAGVGTLTIPTFGRYTFDANDDNLIVDSLDFGVPRQMDMPGVIHPDGCTVYERGWKDYLSDRYDVNTKVMTCRVNFGGIQVNQELLRKFYWYDNSLWVLNAIKNYSLTTYDPVECEFVQVQDKNHYLTGQDY